MSNNKLSKASGAQSEPRAKWLYIWLLLSSFIAVPAMLIGQSLNIPSYTSEPAWSPDGTRIAFVQLGGEDGGIYAMNNERQAFAIGMFCGAGFAILENMLYEGIYAAQGGWSWGGVTLLRGIGAVLHPLGAGLVTLGWFRARASGWSKLLGAYALAVGLHTLWNGGFTALVYLTGLNYYAKSNVLSLYGEPIQISLIASLIALALGLWWLLRNLVTGLAQGIQADVAPAIISRRAIAIWAFACALVMVPLGMMLGTAWSQIQPIIFAGWGITK